MSQGRRGSHLASLSQGADLDQVKARIVSQGLEIVDTYEIGSFKALLLAGAGGADLTPTEVEQVRYMHVYAHARRGGT